MIGLRKEEGRKEKRKEQKQREERARKKEAQEKEKTSSDQITNIGGHLELLLWLLFEKRISVTNDKTNAYFKALVSSAQLQMIDCTQKHLSQWLISPTFEDRVFPLLVASGNVSLLIQFARVHNFNRWRLSHYIEIHDMFRSGNAEMISFLTRNQMFVGVSLSELVVAALSNNCISFLEYLRGNYTAEKMLHGLASLLPRHPSALRWFLTHRKEKFAISQLTFRNIYLKNMDEPRRVAEAYWSEIVTILLGYDKEATLSSLQSFIDQGGYAFFSPHIWKEMIALGVKPSSKSLLAAFTSNSYYAIQTIQFLLDECKCEIPKLKFLNTGRQGMRRDVHRFLIERKLLYSSSEG